MSRETRDISGWCVQSQLIDDDVSGLTLKFDIRPNGEMVLVLYGVGLPHGNRQICFSENGEFKHAATSVLGVERPSWPQHN